MTCLTLTKLFPQLIKCVERNKENDMFNSNQTFPTVNYGPITNSSDTGNAFDNFYAHVIIKI